MSEALKPCPFCGGSACFVKHSAGIDGTRAFDKWDAVACRSCGVTVGASNRRFRSRADALNAWNLRATPEGQTAAAIAAQRLKD